jgi:hypothetical protein
VRAAGASAAKWTMARRAYSTVWENTKKPSQETYWMLTSD